MNLKDLKDFTIEPEQDVSKPLNLSDLSEYDVEDGPSGIESTVSGAFQGATGGFIDELTGGIESLANMVGVRNTHDLSEMELGTPSFDVEENYRRGRDAKRAMHQAASEANPTAYGVGQFGGAVGAGILSGGTSLPAVVAQGALQGLGNSEADLLKGDLKGAAIDTGIGGALGAAGYGAGKLLSAGVEKAAPYVNKARNSLGELLDTGAEKLAVKATGATGNQASKFSPDAGRELLDEGLIKFGDTPSKIADRVGERVSKAGTAIGDAIEELESRGVKASVDNIVSSLESQIDELSQVPGNDKIIAQLQKEVNNLYNRGSSDLGIKAAEGAKRNFQGATNYFSDEAEKKATGRLATGFKNEVERAALDADPSLARKFMDEKKAYGLFAPIEEAASKRAAQQGQSPFGGLTDIVTGSFGGPKAIAGKYAISELGKRTASSGAVISDNLAHIVKTNPQMLGKFAKPLQEAAQRGGNSLAAAHYVLQQTNPEYRKLVNTNEEDTSEQDN